MNKLPLTTSSKLVDVNVGGTALEVNPFANAGITASEAPVLLSLESKVTVDADVFASRIPRSGGHGTASEARLIVNSFAAVMEDLVDEYGAVTVQTPFGTVQTFVTGTLENPQDQPDPERNWLFLGVVIPEAWRRKFAQIETFVPAEVCPVALYRVRDKATNAKGIVGTDPFWLDGWRMSYGGEGETLELLAAATRDKLCDISVDAETKGETRFLCTLAPQTAIEAGDCLVRLVTLAGGEPGGSLWPVELKVALLEAIPAPVEPVWKYSDELYVQTMTPRTGTAFKVGEPIDLTGRGLTDNATAPLYLGNVKANFGETSCTVEATYAADGTSGSWTIEDNNDLEPGTHEGELEIWVIEGGTPHVETLPLTVVKEA